MEFNFTVTGLQDAAISAWDAATLVGLSSVDFHKLRCLLEEFGQRSAVAQGLRAPITDVWRLRSSDQQLYLQTAAAPCGSTVVLGGLKVGSKKLFMHRANGTFVEITPLCVLDFYVHESWQRQGVGKALFEHMLEAEQLAPESLGYDRPSAKLLSFLRRHYGLANFIPQPNNFVVFEQYYDSLGSSPGGRANRPSGRGGSVSSSGCWGPSALASIGNGRQTLHIIGSRAAAGAAPAEQRMPASVRPPTPSLQHSVQLVSPQAAGSGSPTGRCIESTIVARSAWSPVAITGGGCPTAGRPTQRDVPHEQQQQPESWQQQQQSAVQYGRGQGMKGLMHTTSTSANAAHSHAGYQQALMAAAANPAPPRARAGPPLPPWQQQQQAEEPYSRNSGGGGRVCDSLDSFAAAAGRGNDGSLGGCGFAAYTTSSVSQTAPWGTQLGSTSSPSSCTSPKQGYVQVPPYGCIEPLPDGGAGAERVSLRRQAANQAQAHAQLQVPSWVAADAGPPGHLMAAPRCSYAVGTALMADTQWGCGDGSSSGSGGRQGRRQQPPNALCLSWDGMLPPGISGTQSQQQQQQPPWRGQLTTARGSSSSSMMQHADSLATSCDLKAAAASHRSGSGAASCMRMM